MAVAVVFSFTLVPQLRRMVVIVCVQFYFGAAVKMYGGACQFYLGAAVKTYGGAYQFYIGVAVKTYGGAYQFYIGVAVKTYGGACQFYFQGSQLATFQGVPLPSP